MTEVVLVASKNIVSIDQKTHELMVSKKTVEIIIGDTPTNNSGKIHGLITDFIELTQNDIDMGRVYQTQFRVGSILVDVVGAITQHEGVDYIVGEDYIEWKNKELETILIAGDVIRLAYIAKE